MGLSSSVLLQPTGSSCSSSRESNRISSADLPAGAWAITAKGNVGNRDRNAWDHCYLYVGGTRLDITGWRVDDGLIGDAVVALAGVANLGAHAQARVECQTPQDGVEGGAFKILAVRVGSLG